MKVRIGIDVGGTFTDAVALDDQSYELVSSVKIPTTHDDPNGVAAGIVKSLHLLLEQAGLEAKDVSFIAHGTTQATNALLEGDVSFTGIVVLGKGLEGMKSRADATIGDIELAPGKFLHTKTAYVDASDTETLQQRVDEAITSLQQEGARALVAAEAFSVDDARNENLVVERAGAKGTVATATNEISKLYGLSTRTKTAVVNASILPKMLETADMTERSIKDAGIESQLMVMRCDGGVMTVDEVRKRPILTILSGPAAGVAGALMYERLTDGIFFEVGGTSTDISCVKDGRVMVTYAHVGGHKTYLSSLDVRTVGIGGGSMIEVKNGVAVGVGPRSAHIAGLQYEVYTEKLDGPTLTTVRPREGDPDYAAVTDAHGVTRALTLAGAANIAGYVRPEDYAYGDAEAAAVAWEPLARSMQCTVKEAALKVIELAARKNAAVASQIMRDYGMDPRTTVFVGGGGGAASVVPHLAEKMGHKHRMAKNASVISPIGVALAMVRDTVERTVVNPTQDDILAVRNEAWKRAEKAGAAPETIEVSVEVDAQRNLVRAVAMGATELRSKDRGKSNLNEAELLGLCAENLSLEPKDVEFVAKTDGLTVACGNKTKKKLFGLLRSTEHPLRVIDNEGVIRLQKSAGQVFSLSLSEWKSAASRVIEDNIEYNDGGANLPNTYFLVRRRIIDVSGLPSVDQVLSVAEVELASFSPEEELVLLVTPRTA